MHASDISTKNFSPAFLFAIQYTRTANGYPHSHDYIELLYIHSGVGKYVIDGTTYEVTKGNILLINPGVDHANIVTDPAQPLVILALGFFDLHLTGMEENMIAFPGQSPVLTADHSLQEQVSGLFFRMLAEKEQNFPGKYDMMRCYLSQILLYLIRAYAQPSPENHTLTLTSHRRHYVVTAILDYMQEHYSEKLSLEGIASNMYLSPIYLSQLFREETGEPPIHHLIQIRLKKSIQLMKDHPEYSIQKIAAAVGYEDACHFSKIFKKHMHMTPRDYRRTQF